ncbi:MmgE/PrpD family protein [Chelatococcus reniformis]|uniref:MmgE/PrpD family protein n=1 Tax=Chelatococcus reniformis TaxID=1494448 RepID=A0A916U3T0_9HYPH|nr:MmgE/PrpD family protein [Chelatococcus reniformis]GGC59533.1 hypothetical protein GCM10010994_17840 [Chelatococcus reniformis]
MSAHPSSQYTRRLARHVLSYRDAELPAAALTVARQCILDWFAVTLAGLEEPVARLLRDEVTPGSAGAATIVGTSIRCAPADAALVNGATSHALDYDDVHPLVGHPTVAVLPAALAVAEAQGRSGAELLRAFVAGYEAAAAVGTLVMPSHYDRGFHSTGTVGSFGAAAAAGLLLGLDEAQMATALGLAGTQAAGLKSMFGTMAKPLHAGKAASNGVLAARLAARGFTAHPALLDVAQGFVATQSDGPGEGIEIAPPGERVVGTLFKFHAACFLTHSTIEAVNDIRRAHSFAAEDIAAIDLHVPAAHLGVCNIPSPMTGLEVKFSLRHTAALAARGDDTAAIGTYSDRCARDPALVALRERITVHGDLPPRAVAEARIAMRSGTVHVGQVDVSVADTDLGRQGERLTAKFRSLAGAAVGEGRSERLRARIAALGATETIGELVTLA